MNASLRIVCSKSTRCETYQNIEKFSSNLNANVFKCVEKDYWKIKNCVEITIEIDFPESNIANIRGALGLSFSIACNDIIEYIDNDCIELAKYSIPYQDGAFLDSFLIMYIGKINRTEDALSS